MKITKAVFAQKQAAVLTACLFCFQLTTRAQENLLLNPGFEAQLYDQPKSWITAGTVDFYRKGSLLKNGVSTSEPTNPAPFFGDNYIGLRAFPDATEAVAGRFTNPLVKDQWYKISCRVLMPQVDCNLHVPAIAVYPSDSIFKKPLWYGTSSKVPFIYLYPSPEGQMIQDNIHWTAVSAYYKAKGGERVLWVGNFLGANEPLVSDYARQTNAYKNDGILHCVYHYYYDEFSVSKAIDPATTSLTIRNVNFDSGSAQLTEVYDDNLNLLLGYLKDYPDVKIKITGHTDSDGDEAQNQKLSEKRAEAIRKWLATNGIQASRAQTAGKGESEPLATEESAEQKALNRRVEIQILH